MLFSMGWEGSGPAMWIGDLAALAWMVANRLAPAASIGAAGASAGSIEGSVRYFGSGCWQ